jgi:hypothetical protein
LEKKKRDAKTAVQNKIYDGNKAKDAGVTKVCVDLVRLLPELKICS